MNNYETEIHIDLKLDFKGLSINPLSLDKTPDVDSVARLESFRTLKLTLLESFRALKLVKPYWRFLAPFWRVLGSFPLKTHMESFRALILTLLESFWALWLRIVTSCLPNPCMGP